MGFFQTINERWCIPLGKVAGVPILSHFTFWMVVVLVAPVIGLTLLATGACSVLLHEFGHVLVAKRYRIQTKEVLLLPFGAMANMPGFHGGDRAETFIALAGPLVSVFLGVCFFVAAVICGPLPSELAPFPQWNTVQELFIILSFLNFILGIFNMVPAFPMDGGRVLRSMLAKRLGVLRATMIASRVAIVFSAIGFVAGIYLEDIGLLVISVFILVFSQSEYLLLKKRQEKENLSSQRAQFISIFQRTLEDQTLPNKMREDLENFIASSKKKQREENIQEYESEKPSIIGKELTVLFVLYILWISIFNYFVSSEILSVSLSILTTYLTYKLVKKFWLKNPK